MHGSLALFKVMHNVFALKCVHRSYRVNTVKHLLLNHSVAAFTEHFLIMFVFGLVKTYSLVVIMINRH